MRYSIIHHDLREKFGLSVSEYIVCDSISKLARLGGNKTTHKSNVEIGKFIGYDEKTVRRAKAVLLEKGLIFEMLEGFGPTPVWEENEILMPRSRQNAAPSGQNAEISGQNAEDTISNKYNKDKEDTAEADFVFEDEDEVKPRAEKEGTKRYDDLCRWLSDLTGAPIPNKLKQFKHLRRAKEAGINPSRLKERAEELWGKDFYQANGMDWGAVVSSFDRKA